MADREGGGGEPGPGRRAEAGGAAAQGAGRGWTVERVESRVVGACWSLGDYCDGWGGVKGRGILRSQIGGFGSEERRARSTTIRLILFSASHGVGSGVSTDRSVGFTSSLRAYVQLYSLPHILPRKINGNIDMNLLLSKSRPPSIDLG